MCQGDLEDFFQYLEDRQRGDGTLESYQRTLLSLYDWLPEEKMISRPVLVRWKKETVSRGYAVRTVNAKISAVNSFSGIQRPAGSAAASVLRAEK